MKSMSETVISLNSIDKVKRFVLLTKQFDSDIDLVSYNKCVINAKSIMGIFSTDLSKPIVLRIHEEGEKAEEIMSTLKDYVVA